MVDTQLMRRFATRPRTWTVGAATAALLAASTLAASSPAPASPKAFVPAVGHYQGDVDLLFLPASLRFDVTRDTAPNGESFWADHFRCDCESIADHRRLIGADHRFWFYGAPQGTFRGHFVDARHVVGRAELCCGFGTVDWRAHLVEAGTPPRFTSAARFELEVGQESDWRVESEGHPAYTVYGTLPAGVHFVEAFGIGHLRGTPKPGSEGTHHVDIAATGRWGVAHQRLTLVVRPRSG
ncbi:MAG TPA: hypothetical protein VFA66_12935 [Gaiellaceae bacterium]|nr:hypothetical protein [Gaiellaceae bacterium]